MLKSLRQHFGSALAEMFERRAERIINSYPKIREYLSHYAKLSPSTGCSYSDYLLLYRWIRDYKPKEILECGTGFSTLVIFQALKENEKEYGICGRLTSMEENDEYYQAALKSLPPEVKSDPVLELILSPAVEDTYEMFRGVRYKDVPRRDYDFVFVDGPDRLVNPAVAPCAFNFDLVKVVQDSKKPVGALIDTRTSTCFVYSLLFPEKFCYDYIRKVGIIYPATKHDLADAKRIVARAMKKHDFRRPALSAILRGRY